MMRQSRGESLGRWTLVEPLGQGGNAEVWRAADGSGCVALKILKQRKTESEAYQRFRQEINALERIGPNTHVVPLLESELPDNPSRARPAWLAMPIGRPLADALSSAPLRDVVTAVAEIAETLADLHERLQIHHRDIKPSNLYLLGEHPAISDFGLVDLPDSDDLTSPGQPLGPRLFLPYEMVVDSTNADPAPADVFSLAKTLWVLCGDQRWPPQGEQHATNEAYAVGVVRPHPLAHHLDQLIERCTQHEPSMRPSMKQVAADLRAWLTLDATTPQQALDLSATWSRLRERAEPRLQQVRDEETQRQCFQAALRRLEQLLEPLHAEIRQQFEATEFNQRHKLVDTLFYDVGTQETSNEDIRATILSGPGWNPVRLIVGRQVRTKVSGEVEYGGLFYLGRTETFGGRLAMWGPKVQRAPCNSVVLDEGLSALARKMQAQFPTLLEQFVAALES